MRFYMPGWQDCLNLCRSRLEIDACCVICGRRGRNRAPESVIDLCDSCESLLIRIAHTDREGYISRLCLGCGQEMAVQSQCSRCQSRLTPFRRIVAPYRYDFPLDSLIQSLKYGDRRVLARVFGSLLAQAAATGCDRLPSHLLPVPLHAERAAIRGFNQAADIARWCAHDLHIGYLGDAVEREVATASLAGLSRAERQHRILGAFRADSRVAGLHLAIVDDVLTTGATARELARELYDTGADSVELWVLARTSSKR